MTNNSILYEAYAYKYAYFWGKYMENNKRSDFIEVYILKTLNEIKNKVTWNIKLDKKRMEETDEKMSILLRELIDSNFKNLQRDPKGNLIYTLLPIVDEKENEKVR